MSIRRVVLGTVAAAGLIAGVAPAMAATPQQQVPVPVGVQHNSDGSVCVWVSEQVPHCTPPTN